MRREEWQEKTLPMMRRILIGLAVFFFLASLGQLAYLQYRVAAAPGIDIEQLSAGIEALQPADGAPDASLVRLEIAARLELDALSRRYHMGLVGLMGNLWVKYLGFVTGMILAIVGGAFVLGKLRESESELEAEVATFKYHIRSASPGIILALLGVILIISTIWVHYEATVKDTATYLSAAASIASPY